MSNEGLEALIINKINSGQSYEQISKSLLQVGFKQDEIDALIQQAQLNKISSHAQNQNTPAVKTPSNFKTASEIIFSTIFEIYHKTWTKIALGTLVTFCLWMIIVFFLIIIFLLIAVTILFITSNTSYLYNLTFYKIILGLFTITFTTTIKSFSFVYFIFVSIFIFLLSENIEKELSFKAVYLLTFQKLRSAVWMYFLEFIIISIGFLIFFLPGIIFLILFSVSDCVLVSENLKGFKAILKSKGYIAHNFLLVTVNYILYSAIPLLLPKVFSYFMSSVSAFIIILIMFIFIYPIDIILRYAIYQQIRQNTPHFEPEFSIKIGKKTLKLV